MNAFVFVKQGYGKNVCEDASLCNTRIFRNEMASVEDKGLRCIAVADGVGGQAGGELACQYMLQRLHATDFGDMTETDLRQLMKSYNRELLQYASENPGKEKMATTLTCIVSAKNGFCLLHGGNTRLYGMQGKYLKQLTHDQTSWQRLMDIGQYDAAQQCNKSEIYGCFGGGNSQYAEKLVIEQFPENIFPYTLVMTSDGVHDFVDIDFMEETLMHAQSDEQAAQKIAEKARQNGSIDDQTIVIVRR